MTFKNKRLSFDEVLAKLMKFCAYQERSEWEVKQKLRAFYLADEDKLAVIEELKSSNFFSDERFARSYIQGKLKIKRWGPYKITSGLSAKGISRTLIDESLKEIDQSMFEENLNYWIEKRRLNTDGSYEKQYRFLISKGFESQKIYEALAR